MPGVTPPQLSSQLSNYHDLQCTFKYFCTPLAMFAHCFPLVEETKVGKHGQSGKSGQRRPEVAKSGYKISQKWPKGIKSGQNSKGVIKSRKKCQKWPEAAQKQPKRAVLLATSSVFGHFWSLLVVSGC